MKLPAYTVHLNPAVSGLNCFWHFGSRKSALEQPAPALQERISSKKKIKTLNQLLDKKLIKVVISTRIQHRYNEDIVI
jgi:hypothetical protein